MTNPYFLATVGAVDADGMTLIFDTEVEPTAKKYKYNRAVTFKAQQRVVVASISGSYVVLAPISGTYKPGSSGIDGATFKPQVSADGVLSWTNNGGYANPAPVNITDLVLDALPKMEWGPY